MNSMKIFSLSNIMEFMDIQTLYNFTFLNKRNKKYSLFKSEFFKHIHKILFDIGLINFDLVILQFLSKRKVHNIIDFKLIFSYLIVKKLIIISQRHLKENLTLSNFYRIDYGISSFFLNYYQQIYNYLNT